jgi:simple sugar transport system ATP-binding protein
MSDHPPYLHMRGITKEYRANRVLANDRVDFRVEQGQIHSLVGENGAGKTTLMKVLDGMVRPDAGEIFLKGKSISPDSPRQAARLGIGMVHQHFRLIRSFTVAENVVLGTEPRIGGIAFDFRKACREVERVAERHGFSIDPTRTVADLSVSEMQQVEIVKVLFRKAELLVLDEPTSVLTEAQIRKLFDSLRALRANGMTIIFISHKVREVMDISDSITVMRRGRVIASEPAEGIDGQRLSRLMVGHGEVKPAIRMRQNPGEGLYSISHLTVHLPGRHDPVLEDIDLEVRRGEVLGVTGVSGSGLSELEDSVCGLIHGQARIASGSLRLAGDDVTRLTCGQLRQRGFAYVPSDRLFRGVSLNSTVTENMIVDPSPSLVQNGFFRKDRVREYTIGLKRDFSIRADLDLPIGMASGGNIQKIVLARELSRNTKFVLFSEPTWGIDLESVSFIYQKILELRGKMSAVMLISTDLQEILTLSDRIVVLFQGKITATVPNVEELTAERIGRYMLGIETDRIESAYG